MKEIDFYGLTFEFGRRPEVADARVATGMCADDTVLVEFADGRVAVLNTQDGYPAVVLGTLYADADGIREHDPLETGLHHDFEDDTDYKGGVDDLITQCVLEPTMKDILEQFDRRDDMDADYIAAHWGEAVDVYWHGGSMLDLDNIVRLETVLGAKVGYDTYHRIDSEVDDLADWLETGLTVRGKMGE